MKEAILGAILAAFAVTTHAGMITMDPSVFDPGTDVTHAYEGASLYTAYTQGSKITLGSVYSTTCDSCIRNESITGSPVFGSDPSTPFFAYTEDVFRVLTGNTTDLGGNGMLVSFDEPTDFVQVVGSSYWRQNSVRLDYWDEVGNWLGNCFSPSNNSCTSKRLFNDPDEYDDQKRISVRMEDPLIKFVTIGGHVGGAIISKVSYVKVPEPTPALVLSFGLLVLLGTGQRKKHT